MPSTAAFRPGHTALRRGRVSLASHLYLVTFTTHKRQPVFANDDRARSFCRALIDERLWRRSRCLAWVLMPDHWHGLISLGTGDDLSHLVGQLKANTSRCIRHQCPGTERLWGRSFHDHALRNDEQELLDHARYVVMNPVRAGLVRRVGDYPYWDAVWL
jgi:putative transposase